MLRPIFDQAPLSTRPKCYCYVNPFGSITVNAGKQFSYVTGDDPGVRIESRQGKGIFLFSKTSRPSLGPTQPPIQWESVFLLGGGKRLGREVDRSHPSSAAVKGE